MWLYAIAMHQTCLTILGLKGLLNRTQTHLGSLVLLVKYLAVAALCNIWIRYLWRFHFCFHLLQLVFVFLTMYLLLFALFKLFWALIFGMTYRIVCLHTMAMKEFRVAFSSSMGLRNRASARCNPLIDWKLFFALTATWDFRNQRCCCYGVDCVRIFLRFTRCFCPFR